MKKFSSILFLSISIMVGCQKSENCFDQELMDQFATVLCTQDCPEVIGCDGKTYCNECIANQHGIRVD